MAPTQHIVCMTCLRQFSEAAANTEHRKLFTEISPFSDCEQGDALVKEARLLMAFSESVSYLMANCDDAAPDHSGSLLHLQMLLAEEAQHRLAEVEILREIRQGQDAHAPTEGRMK
jgi:hypothetical protein